jgi:hypothetical protein
MHDMLYTNNNPNLNIKVGESESSTDWGSIITTGISLLPQLLNLRKDEVKHDTEYRSTETGSTNILKPISNEIAGNTEQSSSITQKSGDTSNTEQQDNNISSNPDKRII